MRASGRFVINDGELIAYRRSKRPVVVFSLGLQRADLPLMVLRLLAQALEFLPSLMQVRAQGIALGYQFSEFCSGRNVPTVREASVSCNGNVTWMDVLIDYLVPQR